MAEPFIFINTYTIKPGKEEAYKTAHQKVADLVEAKEPKMLYFALHTSEDGSEATTVQVHADAENFGYHMSVVEDHVRAAHEYVDYATAAIRSSAPRPQRSSTRCASSPARGLGDGQPGHPGLQPVRGLLTDPPGKVWVDLRPHQANGAATPPKRRQTTSETDLSPPAESLPIPTRTHSPRRRA